MPACNNNPELAYAINTQQITDILSLRSHDQMLLFPNTNSGYGQGEGAVFTEKSELNPISVYGKTKCESEKRVREEVNTVVFRLATVFGSSPKMRLDLLVNDFTYRAWWDGYIGLFESHFKRNYVHVKDVADLFAWSIKNWNEVRDDVFNFGLSEANLSKRELCEKIKLYLPSCYIHEHDDKKDPDQRNYIVLNDKIESRGFKAKRSIDEGIKELLKVFQIIQPQIYSNIL
jgi:nucleoside-diphosphate-sugar epimerase